MREKRVRQSCPRCHRSMRRVHVARKHGEVYNCAKCGDTFSLQRGELVVTAICELIMQTGVGKGGRVLRPHQANFFPPETVCSPTLDPVFTAKTARTRGARDLRCFKFRNHRSIKLM